MDSTEFSIEVEPEVRGKVSGEGVQLVLVTAVGVVQHVRVMFVFHVEGIQLVTRQLRLPDERGGVIQLGKHVISPHPCLLKLLSGDDDARVLYVCLD